MRNHLAEYLTRNAKAGACRLGQILISGDFSLRHIDDAREKDLFRHRNPHDAIEIAKYDDQGKYRPLKTAPNLRHGWLLELRDIREILLALDFLYPAALGTAFAQARGTLEPVALRETLERQTGMYAVVKKITDVQGGQLIAGVCRGQPGCMRRILWNINREQPLPTVLAEERLPGNPVAGGEISLWCAEACGLLVAAGRETVKNQA